MSSDRPTKKDLRPGMTVEIDQEKNSQENANPIRGEILKVLSEEHTEPGGIEVKLESGATGRVKRIVADE